MHLGIPNFNGSPFNILKTKQLIKCLLFCDEFCANQIYREITNFTVFCIKMQSMYHIIWFVKAFDALYFVPIHISTYFFYFNYNSTEAFETMCVLSIIIYNFWSI